MGQTLNMNKYRFFGGMLVVGILLLQSCSLPERPTIIHTYQNYSEKLDDSEVCTISIPHRGKTYNNINFIWQKQKLNFFLKLSNHNVTRVEPVRLYKEKLKHKIFKIQTIKLTSGTYSLFSSYGKIVMLPIPGLSLMQHSEVEFKNFTCHPGQEVYFFAYAERFPEGSSSFRPVLYIEDGPTRKQLQKFVLIKSGNSYSVDLSIIGEIK